MPTIEMNTVGNRRQKKNKEVKKNRGCRTEHGQQNKANINSTHEEKRWVGSEINAKPTQSRSS